MIPETIHALQLDHQFIFHEDIGKALSNRVAFIGDSQRDLSVRTDTAKRKFPKQRALVDFLWKPGHRRIGNLQYRAKRTLGQGI